MRSTLGLDTSGRHGSVALAQDGRGAGWEVLPPGGHSSRLTASVLRLLEGRGVRLQDLAGIAVVEGPGSFTGLRIGLGWAKGAALGAGLKLALVSAHEAHAWRHRSSAARIATVLPGERGAVSLALWGGGTHPHPERGPERVPEEDLEEILRASSGALPLVVAPDLDPETLDLLEEDGVPVWREPVPGTVPSLPPLAAAVAELGDRAILEGALADPVAAAPTYGRAPNARKPSP